MIRLIHIFHPVFVSVLLWPIQASAGEKITLEQAKQYAIKKNYHLEGLRNHRSALEAQSDLTGTKFLPKLGLVGGVNSYGEVAKEVGPVGYAYLNYNLFNGYRDQINSDLAKVEVEKADLVLSKEEFKIGLDVEEAFHTYVYFNDLIEMQNSALNMNSNHKSLVKKTKKAGLSSATDVMEFKLKDAILRSDLELVKQNLEETRISLRKLLGEEVGSKVTPAGAIQHQHLNGTLMSYLDRIKSSSFPVKMAALDLKGTNTKSEIWRSSWLPSIDLEVQAGQLPIEARDEKREFNVNFLLTANFELFSGFESRYEKRKQYSLLARDESRLKDRILYSISEMEKSFRRLKTIERRVDLEEHNVDRSKDYYEGVKKEYLRGYKNSADLASAAERYIESKKRKIEFMYDFLMEKIKLERSLGAKVDVEIID